MTEVFLGIGSNVDAEYHVRLALAELAPTLRHPVTGQPFCEAWALRASADTPWTRAGRFVTTPLPEQQGSVVQRQPIAAAEQSCAW